MAHAIRLYFDAALEAALIGVRTALTSAGISPTLEALGDRLHVSVAGADAMDVSLCASMLERVAQARPSFATSLAAFGLFPGDQGVVYLTPTPSESLLDIHREVYGRLTSVGIQLYQHFRPEGWVPHVTVGFELSQPEVAMAVSWLHANFKPLSGRFGSIGLIEYYPVREIATFPFVR